MLGDINLYRYCPLNKDGHHNSGASLVELKKKKNAAGNYPSTKRMYPIPPYHHDMVSNKNSMQYTPKMTTAPLPSSYRPPFPTTSPPTQIYHDIQYHNTKQMQHQTEVDRLLKAIRTVDVRVPSPTVCYSRNFPSPKSCMQTGSPQDRFIFPEMVNEQHVRMSDDNIYGFSPKIDNSFKQKMHDDFKQQKMVKIEDKTGKLVQDDYLGNMLAELREGTEEIAMF